MNESGRRRIRYIIYLGKDRSICENSSYLLHARNAGNIVNWQDGSSGRSITVSKPGKYWATVRDSYDCSVSDTLVVTHISKNPANFLPDTMIICSGWNTDIRSLVS